MNVTRRPVRRYPADDVDWDDVAVEEPLEIRVEGQPLAVTLRTPGDDLDLAAGFLYTEQILEEASDLVALAHVDVPGDRRGNTVDALLAGGVDAHRAAVERATRDRFATSACGLCGKASIDRIVCAVQPHAAPRDVEADLLVSLPARLRAAQAGFERTGGLHAAALFTFDGTLDLVREDVGRHNAVDKVLGARLRADRVPVDDRILVVSSRAGYELVQKAAIAGVPVLCAFGAATSLAIDLAVQTRTSLYGFLRDGRFNRYV